MKKEIKFNHDAEHMAQALGIQETPEQISDEITDVVKDWMISDDHSKNSKLAERIHDSLSYELILFLATKEVYSKVKDTFQDVDVMRDLMREMSKVIKEVKDEEDRASLN